MANKLIIQKGFNCYAILIVILLVTRTCCIPLNNILFLADCYDVGCSIFKDDYREVMTMLCRLLKFPNPINELVLTQTKCIKM